MTTLTISKKAVYALRRGLNHKGYHDPEIEGFTYLGRSGYYKKWIWANDDESICVSCTPRNHWVKVFAQHFEGYVTFVRVDDEGYVWIGCDEFKILIDVADSFEEV